MLWGLLSVLLCGLRCSLLLHTPPDRDIIAATCVTVHASCSSATSRHHAIPLAAAIPTAPIFFNDEQPLMTVSVPLFTAACPCSRRAASKVPSLLFTRGARCRLFSGGGLIRVRVSSRRREDLSQLAVAELAPPVLIPFAEEFVNRLLGYVKAEGGHGSVELGAAYLPIGCNQGSSGLIRLCGTRRGLPAHRMQSGLIRAHQALWNSARLTCPSDAIRAHQGSSRPISAHRCSSVLIPAHQDASRPRAREWFGVLTRFTLRGVHLPINIRVPQLAIICNQMSSVAISSNHLPITIGVPAAEEVEHARRVRPKRARELLSN
jgi:hypothetical protein